MTGGGIRKWWWSREESDKVEVGRERMGGVGRGREAVEKMYQNILTEEPEKE